MSDLTPPGALQVVPGTPGPAELDTVTQGLLVPVQTDQRFRHFPAETYALTPHANLVRFLRVLMGDAGAGQLRKRLVLARLGQILSSSYFYDLDAFYGALFGMQRAPAETLSLDPYTDTASPDDWNAAAAADASYRSRLFQFGRAIEYGPSPVGMKLVAEAILGVTCDIYESFLYADQLALTYGGLQSYTYGGLQAFTYAGLEGMTGTVANSLQRKQFIISPHRPVSVVEANNVLAVVNQLKPADAVVQVLAQSTDVYSPVSVTGVWADSNYWEIRAAVTVTSTGATAPYGAVQPGTVMEPTVPPFSAYQGEQWFYNKDITGALAYAQDPAQNVLTGTGSDHQRIVWADGTYTDYLPTNAPLPWWMALLGRYGQDGVMAINPLSGRGNLATNASASLSSVTFDGVDMDTLLATLAQQNTTANNFQLTSDSVSFWSTDNRAQDDPTRDILEVRFGTTHNINAVALDVAHFPSHISVEYFDKASGGWYSMLQHDLTESVPAVLANNDDYLLAKVHPQHYGEDHWVSLATKTQPLVTDRVRVVLTRRSGKGPIYSQITTQPGPRGGFATKQTPVPYSLAVRRLKVGYSVEGQADLPWPGLPSGLTIDSATDIMGSPVSYSLYMEHATGPIAKQPVQWRCSPQPLASSVVNFYLDVRTPSGAAQVIDRFLIDPTHLGVHATLYYSNATPTAGARHVAQDIPLIYPAAIINGNVVTVPKGLLFPAATGTTGNIDVSNTGLQFDPGQDWWVGLRFQATRISGSMPFIDIRGIEIGHGDQMFTVNPVVMITGDAQNFEGGTTGGYNGYQCTLANSTAQAYEGTHALRATNTTTTGAYFNGTTLMAVAPGQVVDARAWAKPLVDGAKASIAVGWYDANRNFMTSVSGPTTTLSANSWTQVPAYGCVAPAGAAFFLLFLNMLPGAIGDYTDWDYVMATLCSISAPVALPQNGYVHLVVGYTHTTQKWTLAYQIGENDEFNANPPVIVQRVQPPSTSAPRFPNIRIGGDNTGQVPSTSGMLLMGLTLKGETLTNATIADYMANPEPYADKGAFVAQDQGKTANAYLRFDADFVSVDNPAGLLGGPPTFYPSLTWTPIAGDYLLTTGYLVVPPTLAKFWKIEMTNLAPEPFEGFLPVQTTVQSFPAAVVNASAVATSVPGYQGPMSQGLSTLIALGQGENPYPYTGTGGAPAPRTASSLTMSPTQVMVSRDPATAQQLAGASWLYNFTDYHQGMRAPRFATPGVHNYQTADVPYTAKVAFFCGFNAIQAIRTSALAQNDAPVYYEEFLDGVFIQSNTFTQNPGDMATPIDPGQAGVLPCVAQSVVFLSTHDVMGLQFATHQSDPVQVVYDDDMRNQALASTTWRDTGTWHAVGDVAPIQVTYQAPTNSIVFSRQSNPPPPAQNVAGAVTGHMNPPIEPPLRTQNLAQSQASVASISYGGICSAPLLLSPRGRAWVAVRYTPLTNLTSPLYVQLIDVPSDIPPSGNSPGTPGRLVWEAQTSGPAGAVTEFTAPYDIGSVPNQNVANSLYVRLVQKGKSNDVISVDAISIFDESIVWEFSVDGGVTFWQAIDSRNNPNGVLRFPIPSQQLVWRVTCYRESMHISSLQIRPIYENQLNMDAQPFMRGPNISTYDTTPDVYSDPMFQQWTNAVPRWWFLAFKQYPNLFPDGVPLMNVFSNFYNRTTTDNLGAITDTATSTKTAYPDALEFIPAMTDSATWNQGHFTRNTTDDVSASFGDAVSFYVSHPAIVDNLIQPPGGNKIIT